MVKFTEHFDTYSLRARLRPALLVLFPAIVTIANVFPVTYKTVGTGLVSLASICGVLVLFSQAARFFGRKKEKKLYEIWGGLPTTLWLRHQNTNLDAMTKKRYHDFLVKHVPKLKLPNEKEEQKNQAKADDSYRSATKWLLEYTRDRKKYPLIFEENVNYGFQRNTLALKSIALCIIALCLVGTVFDVYLQFGLDLPLIKQGQIVSLGISLLAAIVWITVVTPDWVKDAADAYARALLAACEK